MESEVFRATPCVFAGAFPTRKKEKRCAGSVFLLDFNRYVQKVGEDATVIRSLKQGVTPMATTKKNAKPAKSAPAKSATKTTSTKRVTPTAKPKASATKAVAKSTPKKADAKKAKAVTPKATPKKPTAKKPEPKAKAPAKAKTAATKATAKTTPKKPAAKKSEPKTKAPAKTKVTATKAPAKSTPTKPAAKKSEPKTKAPAKTKATATKATAKTTPTKPAAKKSEPKTKAPTKPKATTTKRSAQKTEKAPVPTPAVANKADKKPTQLKSNYGIIRPSGAKAQKPTTKPTATKSRLSDATLEIFRKRLLADRAAIEAQLNAARSNALRQTDEENQEEDGSNSFNRAADLNRADDQHKRLRAIDDALLAIKEKTYGICSMCGKPIPRDRLEAAPFAIRCVTCKEIWEKTMAKERNQSL